MLLSILLVCMHKCLYFAFFTMPYATILKEYSIVRLKISDLCLVITYHNYLVCITFA
jgi:hypothetical protein